MRRGIIRRPLIIDRLPKVTRPGRAAIAAAALTAVLGTGVPLPARAAPLPQPLGAAFFGVHYSLIGTSGPTGWPGAPVGSVRLWDTGVTWRAVEPVNDRYDFRRLDAQVRAALAHGADPMIVLGQTPRWAAANPHQGAFLGAGAASPPRNENDYRQYVHLVVRHLRATFRRSFVYQPWNEPNVGGFWTGTPQQIARLSFLAVTTINRDDPGAYVVAPSFVNRIPGQQGWYRRYFGVRIAGHSIGNYFDALAFSMYPVPTAPPEAVAGPLATARRLLREAGVAPTKPIWNTEINYGMGLAGGPTQHVPPVRGAGYVSRTYLLQAGWGIRRVYWYAWNFSNGFLGIEMTGAGSRGLSRPGRAFVTTYRWMVGSRMLGCFQARSGVWTCSMFLRNGRIGRAMWHPTRAVAVRAPAKTVSVTTLDGVGHAARAGQSIGLSPNPVLVTSLR